MSRCRHLRPFDPLRRVGFPNTSELLGVAVCQGPQQHAVEDAEDRRVDPNREAEGQHDDGGESGMGGEKPERLSNVAFHGVLLYIVAPSARCKRPAPDPLAMRRACARPAAASSAEKRSRAVSATP